MHLVWNCIFNFALYTYKTLDPGGSNSRRYSCSSLSQGDLCPRTSSSEQDNRYLLTVPVSTTLHQVTSPLWFALWTAAAWSMPHKTETIMAIIVGDKANRDSEHSHYPFSSQLPRVWGGRLRPRALLSWHVPLCGGHRRVFGPGPPHDPECGRSIKGGVDCEWQHCSFVPSHHNHLAPPPALCTPYSIICPLALLRATYHLPPR